MQCRPALTVLGVKLHLATVLQQCLNNHHCQQLALDECCNLDAVLRSRHHSVRQRGSPLGVLQCSISLSKIIISICPTARRRTNMHVFNKVHDVLAVVAQDSPVERGQQLNILCCDK